MGRYFSMLFGTGYTNAELEKVAKFDVICLHPTSFSPFTDPTLISRVKSRNGSAKVLVYVDAAWAALSGSRGAIKYAGNPDALPPYSLPYNTIEYWKSYRCWSQNQYAVNPNGVIVTGQTLGTGWGLIDYTDSNPIGSDGRNFRQAFVSYIVTGIAAKYDIDGIFFDNLDDYHISGLNQVIDFNRDGSAETSGEKALMYSGSVLKFIKELRNELDDNSRSDFKIWFKGNFTGYPYIEGKYFEDAPYDFSNVVERNRWVQITGQVASLQSQGIKTVLNAKINTNTNRTDFSQATNSSRQIADNVFATALLSSSMYHLSNSIKTSIWFVEQIHRKFLNPFTAVINSGSVYYRIYEEGIGAVNTGGNAASFHGYSIPAYSGVAIGVDENTDYYIHHNELGHGFMGALGDGAGKHLNYPGELITVDLRNKIEIAIDNIKKNFLRGVGAFSLSGSTYPRCQIISGDGVKRNFTLNPGVDKFLLMDLVNLTSGSKNPYWDNLSQRNDDSGLYYGLEFNIAPSGITPLIYKLNRSSFLGSNALLTGSRWN